MASPGQWLRRLVLSLAGLASAAQAADAQRGRASGWAQAGNLGGVGLGGGLALWLMQSAGWGSGTACGTCCSGVGSSAAARLQIAHPRVCVPTAQV